MPTLEDLRRLGAELRARRKATSAKSLRAFAQQVGISPTHLSQLERGYVNPTRGLVIPSDEVLEKLSEGLDVPLSRLHALLGRTPDQPYPVFGHTDAVELAERYVRLPEYAKPALWDALRSIEALVERRDKNANGGEDRR